MNTELVILIIALFLLSVVLDIVVLRALRKRQDVQRDLILSLSAKSASDDISNKSALADIEQRLRDHYGRIDLLHHRIDHEVAMLEGESEDGAPILNSVELSQKLNEVDQKIEALATQLDRRQALVEDNIDDVEERLDLVEQKRGARRV